MKIVPKTILYLSTSLFSAICFAGHPPAPDPNRGPPPIGLPIDNNLYLLLSVGLIFAYYIFKKKNTHKKTPM